MIPKSGRRFSEKIMLRQGENVMSEGEKRSGRAVDPKLLEILVCPVTKTTLEYDAARQELISHAAKLAFPIRDGIPILLEEEARRLED
jgi:uncharacterized protein YbaR (Trm112 family)